LHKLLDRPPPLALLASSAAHSIASKASMKRAREVNHAIPHASSHAQSSSAMDCRHIKAHRALSQKRAATKELITAMSAANSLQHSSPSPSLAHAETTKFIFDVCADLFLSAHTAALAIGFSQRYISCISYQIPEQFLSRMGRNTAALACILIAAKVGDGCAPGIHELLDACHRLLLPSVETPWATSVLSMELAVCFALKWHLDDISVYAVLLAITECGDATKAGNAATTNRAVWFADQTFDLSLFRYSPAMLAASCLVCADAQIRDSGSVTQQAYLSSESLCWLCALDANELRRCVGDLSRISALSLINESATVSSEISDDDDDSYDHENDSGYGTADTTPTPYGHP